MIVEQYSDDSLVLKKKNITTSLAQVKPESSQSGKLGHVAVC